MAECKIVTSRTVVLRLTEEEAIFIRDLCQNKIGHPDYDEPPKECAIRSAIFKAMATGVFDQ